jgi:hypothetical protein
MKKKEPRELLDVALLPLEDGRKLMVPMQVLVEVQLLEKEPEVTDAPEEMSWRGHDLPIESLDVVCGLPMPARENISTVGVFKADKNSSQPFRALSFCGNSAHRCIEAFGLQSADVPEEGYFLGATRLEEQVCLIPDLPKLLFSGV